MFNVIEDGNLKILKLGRRRGDGKKYNSMHNACILFLKIERKFEAEIFETKYF